jgi:predicted peptidase
MNKLIILLLLVSSSLAAQVVPKHPDSLVVKGYLEHLPIDYNTTTKRYPTIIFLHGSGERGLGTDSDLNRVAGTALPKVIKNGHTMCFGGECFIVLAPQTNKWSWRSDVMPFIKWAKKRYRIDTTRIYVTGLSMGGEGTWLTALDPLNKPNQFAAIAPVCGRASYTDGQNAAKAAINVWAFHGALDKSIILPAGLNPIMGMRSIANSEPLLSVYENMEHYIWDKAYSTSNNFHSPNLYQWFLTKKKP